MVARLGPEVDPGVAVGGVKPRGLEVDSRRRGNVVHLVAQGSGLDLHSSLDAGHPVDPRGVRAGDVDDDRRGDRPAVGERHSAHPATGAQDLHDLGPEHEASAVSLRGALKVVRRELGIVHVSRSGRKYGPLQLLRRSRSRTQDPRAASAARTRGCRRWEPAGGARRRPTPRTPRRDRGSDGAPSRDAR